MNFYLIDKVKEIKIGKSALGIKCWSIDNQIFDTHFPGFPTVPGVLLTESMAQLSGVLIEQSYYKDYKKKENIFPILSIIQKAKFRSFVEPGKIQVFKKGLGHLMKENMNIPIIPVYLEGIGRVLPKGNKIMLPGITKIYFGNPIFLENESVEEIVEKAENAVHDLKNRCDNNNSSNLRE